MLNEIVAILGKYPQIRHEKSDNLIRVLPTIRDGFEVVIEEIWEDHFSVSYDRWHEDFYNLEEAMDSFFQGLSNRRRLKVECKEGTPFRWTVEYLDDAKWQERSSHSVWNYRFLSPVTSSYLQNDLLSEKDLQQILNNLGQNLHQTASK